VPLVQIREFLGAADFCKIWIPNYSLLAKPQKEERAGTHGRRSKAKKKAFKQIKRALTNTSALGLLDVIKPFFLYVLKRLETVIGVLTQLLGSWHHPVAYLSKQLDALSQG
jgi:hypothetical protein